MKRKSIILGVLIAAIVTPVLAVNYASWSGHAAGKGSQPGDSFRVTGFGTTTSGSFGYDLLVGRNLLVTGILTPSTYAPTSSYLQAYTSSDVALTSPTVSFSATGKYFITLTSDANQTGVYPTGGVLGQEIRITGGAGSNTMRFDDTATTLALGANITLTESQDDFLTLQCTEAQGTNSRSRWAAVSAHDN